jgi:integrase
MQDRTVEQLAPATERARVRVAPNLWRTAGGRYELKRRDPSSGRQVSRTLQAKTLREAQREARALTVRIDRGEAPEPTNLTCSAAAGDYFLAAESRVGTGEMSRRTLDIYRQRWAAYLEPSLGRLKVQAVQATHIGAVLRELREEGRLSSWALHGILTAAGAVFAHAVARGWIAESPTKRLAKGERPRARNQKRALLLGPDESHRVIGCATDRWKPLYVAAAHTGARISELLALQWSDIDWAQNTISISKQLGRDGKLTRPKTERGVRVIGMSPELRRTLREHWVAQGQLQGFIFACSSGAPPTYTNARRALGAAVKAAGIDFDTTTHRVGFHGFRHGAVSALIRNGADPVRVAMFIGDDVRTILSTYSHEWASTRGDDLGDLLGTALSISDSSR